MLEQWGTDHSAASRTAAGWAGDQWQLVEKEGRSAIVLKSTWETPEAAREEGVAIAREMLIAVRGMVQGAQISAPSGRYSAAADVLEALGS